MNDRTWRKGRLIGIIDIVGRSTEITKNILPIVVVALLINLAFSSSVSAESPFNQQHTLTIWMPEITEDDYFVQVEVSEEELQIIRDKLNDFLEVISTAISIDGPGGSAITSEEWQQIGNCINDLIDSITSLDEDFPNVNTTELVLAIIDAFFQPFGGFLLPSPIFSIGRGFTWIPFYDYESFLGVMLRPMITLYDFAFTRIGGLISRHRAIGIYPMLIIRFSGLFINFGDIGFDRISGPTIYIGTALFVKI